MAEWNSYALLSGRGRCRAPRRGERRLVIGMVSHFLNVLGVTDFIVAVDDENGAAVDAVFLDRELRVVKIAADLRPWRVAGRRGAKAVLEIPAGEAGRRGVTVGDRLVVG